MIFGVGIIVTALILEFLSITGHSIALLFVAIVIGEAVSPIVNRMAKFMPQGAAVGLLVLALVASIIGLGLALQSQITEQTTEFIETIPDYIDRTSELVDELPLADRNDVWAGIQSNAGEFTMALVSVPVTVFTSIAQVFIVGFMAAYWTLSRRPTRKFLESLVPEPEQPGMRKLLQELSNTVGGYVRGSMLSALTVGTVVFVGLTIMDVKFPLIMAIFAAFGELIPIVGPSLAAIPAVIFALQESWQLGVAVIVFYVVLQQVEGVLLVPLLMNSQANIPPLIVIISISFGGAIAGVLGAIIAIPAAGAIRVIILRVVAPAIRQWSGADPSPSES